MILQPVWILKTDLSLFREISIKIDSATSGLTDSKNSESLYPRFARIVRNASMRSGVPADQDTALTTTTASRGSASKTFSFNNYFLSVLLMVRNLSFGEALCTRKSQL